jgi:hypothetical protein
MTIIGPFWTFYDSITHEIPLNFNPFQEIWQQISVKASVFED